MPHHYKISEFAKNLGVTPGFLKHHEQYGTLKPQVAESGYRYYRPSDGMQVLGCLKLQAMGFTSREAADILNSSSCDLADVFHARQETLAHKIRLYQETLAYMQEMEAKCRLLSAQGGESCTIEEHMPFYYVENMQEGDFVSDPAMHQVAAAWNELMPLVEHVSHFSGASLTDGGVQAGSYGMGLCVRKDHADQLGLYINDTVRLVEPGRSLVYRFQGVRGRAYGDRSASIAHMLQRPLTFCRDHQFEPTGEAYVIKLYCSLALPENHVQETVILPLKSSAAAL